MMAGGPTVRSAECQKQLDLQTPESTGKVLWPQDREATSSRPKSHVIQSSCPLQQLHANEFGCVFASGYTQETKRVVKQRCLSWDWQTEPGLGLEGPDQVQSNTGHWSKWRE
jgi:hypothetical protein